MSTRADQPRPHNAGVEPPTPTDSDDRRAARELRDAHLRASLTPLAPGERPPALVAAIIAATVLAVAIAVGTARIHDLSRHGGSVPGGVFLSCVLLVLAAGMFRRRYWAVVGFEALLVFQMLVSTLALVLASSAYAALASGTALALGGWLFWKLIRVMARVQAGEIDRDADGLLR